MAAIWSRPQYVEKKCVLFAVGHLSAVSIYDHLSSYTVFPLAYPISSGNCRFYMDLLWLDVPRSVAI